MESTASVLKQAEVQQFVQAEWNKTIQKSLQDFIRIPNLSPMFDEKWNTNGLQIDAAKHILKWADDMNVKGYKGEIIKEDHLTPLVFIEVEASSEQFKHRNMLMYGHLDKQPPFVGWKQHLGPTKPVVEGDRLYGRGGADDGYAIYAAIMAIKTCQEKGASHGRCVIIVEASEESGSCHLQEYCDLLKSRIGVPDTVLCLDSGCGNYEQIWVTTSLRGVAMLDLNVKILEQGVHSGDASGVVPSSFRIIRMLLDRIENAKTGQVLLPELVKTVPQDKLQQAKFASEVVGEELFKKFPFVEGSKPMEEEGKQGDLKRYLNRAWGNIVGYTGAAGLPELAKAGNVLRTDTSIRLSVRLNPQMSAQTAGQVLKKALQSDPPYGAKVTASFGFSASGWVAPPFKPWIKNVLSNASKAVYGKDSVFWGEGGSIPFMGMLGEKFPEAQIIVTGILGPESNAHGPNEFLSIPYTKKIMQAMAYVVEAHSKN